MHPVVRKNCSSDKFCAVNLTVLPIEASAHDFGVRTVLRGDKPVPIKIRTFYLLIRYAGNLSRNLFFRSLGEHILDTISHYGMSIGCRMVVIRKVLLISESATLKRLLGSILQAHHRKSVQLSHRYRYILHIPL